VDGNGKGSKRQRVARYTAHTRTRRRQKAEKMEPYIGEAEQELTTAEIHEIEMKYREAERNVRRFPHIV